MEIIGNGSFHYFEEKDEKNHTPDVAKHWQESVVLYFWDPDRDVYSFVRIGRAPNKDGGLMIAWLNAWTPDYMYTYHTDSAPLLPDSVTDNSVSIDSNRGTYEFLGKGQHRFTINDKDVEVDLVITDDYPGIGFFPRNAGTLVDNSSKHHIESIGNVTGRVSIKGKQYEVSGRGWRDRSWGPRDWQTWRCHRGYIALFEGVYVYALTFLGDDGKLFKVATIIQNNTIQFIDQFEITAYVGEDGISNSGGLVTFEIENQQQQLEFKPVAKATTNMVDGVAVTDSMCRVKWGNKMGTGFAETTHHSQGGEEQPFIFPESHSVLKNGIHPRE